MNSNMLRRTQHAAGATPSLLTIIVIILGVFTLPKDTAAGNINNRIESCLCTEKCLRLPTILPEDVTSYLCHRTTLSSGWNRNGVWSPGPNDTTVGNVTASECNTACQQGTVYSFNNKEEYYGAWQKLADWGNCKSQTTAIDAQQCKIK